MTTKVKFFGLAVPLTIAGAVVGWLLSPLTDGLSGIGILLFTPPSWAIAGFVLALMIEWRNHRKQPFNDSASNQDDKSEPI